MQFLVPFSSKMNFTIEHAYLAYAHLMNDTLRLEYLFFFNIISYYHEKVVTEFFLMSRV